MKDQILKLISDYPKHYSAKIKRDQSMMTWIDANCQTSSNHLPTRIWSAVNGEATICHLGNERTVSRFNSGLQFCGSASQCKCLRDNLSDKVEIAKSKYSEDKKQEIKTKRESTMEEKFGVKYSFQRSEVKEKISKPKVSDEVFAKLTDYRYCFDEYEVKKRSLVDMADELKIYYGTVREYLVSHGFDIRQQSNYSLIERDIGDFVESLGVSILRGDRTVLGGNREIDVLIPTRKLGIEMNGLYYHSFGGVDQESNQENKKRHLSKTLDAKAQGIELIHVTDYEWINERLKIENLIKSKMGLLDGRVPARKLEIKEVEKDEERDFLERYHLQGYIPSKNCPGLYLDGDLVMLASFGRPRYTSEYDHELLRVCSKAGTSVVGGLSRLVKNFHKNNGGSIISYCHHDKSHGKGYLSSGFELVGLTEPGFIWNDGTKIINRMKTTHAELKNWLPSYDSSKSQSQNMFDAGYRRYWDCGQLVFRWKG